MAEGEPGRYRVEGASGPAATAALATWLAERNATLTDLAAGRSLEEVYFEAVGARALEQTAAATSGAGTTATAGRPGRGRRRGERGGRGGRGRRSRGEQLP